MSEATTVFKRWDFTYEGQTWNIGRPTIAVERSFAKYLEAADLEAIRRHKENMDQMDYAVCMEAWQFNCGAGNKYAWNSMSFRQALMVPENNMRLLWHWFGAYYNSRSVSEKKELGSMVLSEAKLHEIWAATKKDEDGKACLDDQGTPIFESREQLKQMLREALDDPNPLLPSAR